MQTIRTSSTHFELVTPSETDVLLAGKTGKRLAALLKSHGTGPIKLTEKGESGETLEIPASAMRLLVELLTEMAQGHAVTLMPVQEEISTQQAADMLNISRPFLVQILEKGEIPFRKVGTRRRIKLEDVIQYKRTLYTKRLEALNELTDYDQTLGLQ